MLEAALEAVAQAGRVCRLVQGAPGGPERIVKSDHSPVTIGDFAAQAVVARVLRERLGGLSLVGEESSAFLRGSQSGAHLDKAVAALRESGAWPDAQAADVLDAIDDGAGRAQTPGAYWTVDPIDGTRGFLRGQQYCVCLAYMEAGQPTIGVLGCPNMSADLERPFTERDPRGVICYATAGGGAHWTPADQPHAPARPLPGPGDAVTSGARITESVSGSHSDRAAFEAVRSRLSPPGVSVKLDSQCKYAAVARGQADAYLRIPPRAGHDENIWDHAPGVLLVREAGCVASDVRGRPLVFGSQKLEGAFGIAAARAGLHGRIVRAVADAQASLR